MVKSVNQPKKSSLLYFTQLTGVMAHIMCMDLAEAE